MDSVKHNLVFKFVSYGKKKRTVTLKNLATTSSMESGLWGLERTGKPAFSIFTGVFLSPVFRRFFQLGRSKLKTIKET